MAEENLNDVQIFNENDPLDINELAALNNDISPEFIEQLQSKITQNVNDFNNNINLSEDETLFEETNSSEDQTTSQENPVEDSFMKKYKAKQVEKNLSPKLKEENSEETVPEQDNTPKEQDQTVEQPQNEVVQETKTESQEPEAKKEENNEPPSQETKTNEKIEDLSSGNIKEKPASADQIAYNESLDLIDNNINYSKYVIYINPENKNFIDSLTVKERKNLINRIIREQDDVAMTKRKWGIIQTIIRHSIVAIITIAIAIPVIYMTINASLEASIDNYRRSQSNFQTLYKEHGKIKAPHKQ